jgi:hypothetical protein
MEIRINLFGSGVVYFSHNMPIGRLSAKGHDLMPAQIIAFPKSEGNGAREALIEILAASEQRNPEGRADTILTLLYYRGFKVVPLDGTEDQ